MGSELRDRTLGVVGLGGIAPQVIELLAHWGMKPPLAFDPFVDLRAAAEAGVRRSSSTSCCASRISSRSIAR